MAADKELIVIVEGTAALGMHWATIRSHYLDKIVRAFCGDETIYQSHIHGVEGSFALQLVVFFAYGSHGPIRSGWITQMSVFMDHLNAIQFVGGGFSDAATTYGLADALTMFDIPPNGYKTTDNLEGKRHCILVAASNPFPLPVPVCRPNFDNCKDPYLRTHDGVAVARWFSQCCVSLSVICPWKSSKIREIYEAGKRNPNSEDQPVNIQHPNFLVMISEDFKEARVALSSTMLAPYNDASLSHADSKASPTYHPESLAVKFEQMSYGNIFPTNVEMDLAATNFSTPEFCPSAPCIPCAAETLNLLGCQTSISSLVDMSPFLLAVLSNAAHVLHAQENALLAYRDLASLESQSTVCGDVSNMTPASQTSGSSMVPGLEVVTGTSQHVKNSAVSSDSSSTKFETKLSYLGNLHPSSNLQGSTTVIMEPTEASVKKENTAQLEGSVALNRVTNMNLGSTDVTFSTQIPTLEKSQESKIGKQSDGSTYCAVSKPVPQGTPGCLPMKQCNYIKVWEGKLFASRQGEAVFISGLEAYKKGSTPSMLGADWPESIIVNRLMLQDRMKHEYNSGRATLLAFRVVNQHAFIGQLFKRKLCAVIELPSQRLLLSVSDKPTRMIGMLFPKDDFPTSSASPEQ